MSAILKRKRGRAKSFVSALCENEAGALSADQKAGLQYKINSANQGVVEWLIINLFLLTMWVLLVLSPITGNECGHMR